MSVVTLTETPTETSTAKQETITESSEEFWVLLSNLPACLNEFEIKRLFDDDLDHNLKINHCFSRCILTVHSDEIANALCYLNGHIFDDHAIKVERIDAMMKMDLVNTFDQERSGVVQPPMSERIALTSDDSGSISRTDSGSFNTNHMDGSPQNMVSGLSHGNSNPSSLPKMSESSQKQSVTSVEQAMALIEAMAKPESHPSTKPEYGSFTNGASMIPSDGSAQSDELARTVYVGNVNPLVGEDHLRAFFQDCGHVLHLKILGNALHQASRYAFVEFDNVQSAQNAYSKGGQVLVDRPLKIGKATNPIFKTTMNTPNMSGIHSTNPIISSLVSSQSNTILQNQLLALLSASQPGITAVSSSQTDYETHSDTNDSRSASDSSGRMSKHSRSSRHSSPRSHPRHSRRNHSHSRSRSRESRKYH